MGQKDLAEEAKKKFRAQGDLIGVVFSLTFTQRLILRLLLHRAEPLPAGIIRIGLATYYINTAGTNTPENLNITLFRARLQVPTGLMPFFFAGLSSPVKRSSTINYRLPFWGLIDKHSILRVQAAKV